MPRPKTRPRLNVKRHQVTQPLDKPYRFIPLTRKQSAIVDVEDFEWLSRWNWYAQWAPTTHSFYAVRKENYGKVRIHRIILDCGPDKEVDHRNHDTLDNRRENLRKCTRLQNGRNQRTPRDNTSGFKGVSWDKQVGKWRVMISIDRHQKSIGYFRSRENAARAYDKVAKKHHGEFAHLNFHSNY